MVGPSGSGKSTAWRVLLKALELHEGVEGVAHVIDPKAMTKEALYGVLVNYFACTCYIIFQTYESADLFSNLFRIPTLANGAMVSSPTSSVESSTTFAAR